MTESIEPDSKDDLQKNVHVGSMLTWILLGSALLFGGGVLVIWLWLEGDWTDKAPIGDALNILTSLFSALAFAAVALSLWFQHREVSSTIDEMRDANESSRQNLERQAQIAEAMRVQAEALYRPYLVFRLELGRGSLISLVVENTGKTAARRVRLTTTYPGSYPGVHKSVGNLCEASFFKYGSDVFAPGQRIHYIIAQGSAIHKEDPEFRTHPSTFLITARYHFDGREQDVSEDTTIDMRLFFKSFIFESAELKELTKVRRTLEKASKHLAAIAKSRKSR